MCRRNNKLSPNSLPTDTYWCWFTHVPTCLRACSGIPFSDVNLRTHELAQPPWTQYSSLSEVATLCLEFTYLERAAGAQPGWLEVQGLSDPSGLQSGQTSMLFKVLGPCLCLIAVHPGISDR